MFKARFSKIKRWCSKQRWLLLGSTAFVALLLFVPTFAVNRLTLSNRYNAMQADWLTKVPSHKVAIVFGAGVLPDGSPSDYLKWRILTGVALYKAGKVHKLLMSGDNRTTHYNEPVAMRSYALSLGVKAGDIVLDYAGYDTYDTCYRAKYIFGLTDATLVSQGYHIPRAVMTCDRLGVKSDGVAALRIGRDVTVTYLGRELLSTDKALVEVMLKPAPPVLGEAEPIN